MPARHWLRILLYQDLPRRWVARSLEHDITIEAATMEAAIDWILRIIAAHTEFDLRHGRPPLSSFPGAPRHYWHAFDRATPVRTVVCGGTDGGSARTVLIAATNERPLPTAPGVVIDRPGVPTSPAVPRATAPITVH